jgi:hypothetical protein
VYHSDNVLLVDLWSISPLFPNQIHLIDTSLVYYLLGKAYCFLVHREQERSAHWKTFAFFVLSLFFLIYEAILYPFSNTLGLHDGTYLLSNLSKCLA